MNDEDDRRSYASQRILRHGEFVSRVGGRSVDGRPVVAKRVLASWQRSEEYGVPAENVQPVFSSTHDDESLFFTCGQEVLAALHRTLLDDPVSLMLTDADGVVLNRLSGDNSLLRALDVVHLAPGFGYSERDAGTNGLGLALADRMPSLVRAEEHYAASLCSYTCAAAPVVDPHTGRLQGSVNLTTWSHSSGRLLLALAQSAASNTSALMSSRGGRAAPESRRTTRGEVIRLEMGRRTARGTSATELGSEWDRVVTEAANAVGADRLVLAVGERGSGRTTALAQARRREAPRDGLLAARAPRPEDVEAWLDLWLPELGRPGTSVVISGADELPFGAASRIRSQVNQDPVGLRSLAMTAEHLDSLPDPLADLVQEVVHVPPLRDRVEDVLALARHVARQERGREVEFTAAAQRTLEGFRWPGNVDQLVSSIREAVSRTDSVDVRHLPTDLMTSTTHRLSRIETFERDEIVRMITRPGITMKDAAHELGMSRATLYRKIAQYGLTVDRS